MKINFVKVFVLFFFISTLSFAKTLVVDDDALYCDWSGSNCSNTCENGDINWGWRRHNYKNISDALQNATSNDIIRICPGNYTESLYIENKNGLTFESTTANKNDVIIESSSSSWNTSAFYVRNSSSLKFYNLTIKGKESAINYTNNPGSFELIGSTLYATEGHTFYLGGNPSNFKIINNEFLRAGNGYKSAIQFQAGANGGEITNNKISTANNSGYGIYISQLPNNLIVSGNCFLDIPNEEAYSHSSWANPLEWNGNFWNDYSVFGVVDNNRLSSCSISSITPAQIDFRFDECSWDGTNEEVKDSSENNHNAKSINGANTQNGKVCKSADFDAKYISLNRTLNLGSNWTATFWLKFPLIGANNQFSLNLGSWWNPHYYNVYVVASVTGVGDLGLFLKDSSGDYRFGTYDNSGRTDVVDIPDLGDGWHYFSIVSNGAVTKLYIDDLPTSYSVNYYTSGDLSLVGTSTDSSDRETIGTQMDEFKIFNKVLSSSEIQEIYTNESIGKNYDGSYRSCNCCMPSDLNTTPLEFEGAEITLGNTYSNPNWTHVDFNKTFVTKPVVFILPTRAGAHPASVRIKNVTTSGFDAIFVEPQGEDGPHLDQSINFLAINKGIHKIGNTYFQVGEISTKKTQEKNVLNEWEKIDTIFTSCTPAVVASIQTINNETGIDTQNNNHIMRSKPWLTTAIDVNSSGVYMALERSETNEGDINVNETIGYMIAPANIQDSVVDDNNKNIKFETIVKKDYFVGWDDGCNSVNFVNTYTKKPLVASNKNSKNEADGGWFRSCLLDNLQIGLIIDEDGSSYSKTTYGYSSPPQDRERSHIGESGSVFVFSDSLVIHNDTPIFGSFDAWDTFRNINDRNISTKISNNNFELSIASLNVSRDALEDFNGTVCAKIDDVVTKVQFNSENIKNATFNVNKALKDVRVELSWKRDVDENCPLLDEDNSTVSTDNFAIRPNSFNILLPTTPIKAGENFQVTFKANDVQDYNETINTSFKVDANETKTECKNGVLGLPSFSFANGSSIVDVNYSEVGEVNISIEEINGSEFAKVDFDDTNESERFISKYSNKITVLPHHFDVTATFDNAFNGFTYLSNDLNMSSKLDMNITAKNAKNDTTENYNNLCYAKDIDINIKHTDVNATSLSNLLYIYEDANDINTSAQTAKNSDINLLNYNRSNFTTDSNGSAKIAFYINFDRKRDKGVNPFDFTINDINVTDTDGVSGGKFLGDSVKYYYGRVKTKDISTNEKTVSHSLHVEVFCDSCGNDLNGFKQSSLNWFINKSDNQTKDIVLTPRIDFSYSGVKNGLNIINVQDVLLGTKSFDLQNNWNSSDDAMIHLETPIWLWFSRYNDYNQAADCGYHPCFKYNYILSTTTKGIESGSFSGSSIGKDYNVTKKRVGVKTFR